MGQAVRGIVPVGGRGVRYNANQLERASIFSVNGKGRQTEGGHGKAVRIEPRLVNGTWCLVRVPIKNARASKMLGGHSQRITK